VTVSLLHEKAASGVHFKQYDDEMGAFFVEIQHCPTVRLFLIK
jgi:hypothetical protein